MQEKVFRSYYLDEAGSGFIRNRNVHNEGHFGLGNQSTSYIEQLWSHLKDKIKKTYNVIPCKNIIKFIREAEYKFILRNKCYDEKIRDFFECYKCVNDVKDIVFPILFNLNYSDDSEDED